MTTIQAPWSRPQWLVAVALAAAAVAAPASAQCTTQWQSLGESPITGGSIDTVVGWDPDGPGPLPVQVAAGGSFRHVHGSPTGGVAACVLATSSWSPLASGTDGIVQSLLALPNGDLVAAGPFRTAGGVAANGIARWNGSTWSPLGAGLTVTSGALSVHGLIVLSSGDLVVAGNFTAAGGAAAGGLARWNGTAWTAIPAVVTGSNQDISTLAALPNGEFAVGGDFTAIGGVAAASVARWTGSGWQPFGAGFAGGVGALAVTGNGGLVAAASLHTGGQLVAKWTGSTWQTLANLSFSAVHMLAGLAGDGIAAAGTFSAIGGVAAERVAAWNGAAWAPFGAGFPGSSTLVKALTALPNGPLVVLTNYGPWRWDGVAWRPLAVGPQGIGRLLAEPDGSVLASGTITTATGLSSLSRWNGTAWTAEVAPFPWIMAMARRPNGNLVVGGSGLGEWNGSTWSVTGNQQGSIEALLVMPNGDVIVGGSYPAPVGIGVGRWNGSTWSALGDDPFGTVRALARLPNGDVVAGGDFTNTGTGVPLGHLARWNGVSWAPLGGGVNAPVRCLEVAPNGDLFAVGNFTMAGGVAAAQIARWNGTTWSALPGLPAGRLFALTTLPDGDLVAAGHDNQTSTSQQPLVVRWNGASWTMLSAGLAAQPYGLVQALAFGADGLYAGGTFTSAGNQRATGIARLASTCPASVLAWGSGCAGRTLAASAPWLGSTLRTTGSGPASAALAFVASGFTPTTVPLSTVLPAALPGCVMMVQPDHLAIASFAGGVATLAMVLPNSSALAGVVLRQQMVVVELSGSFTATASNALLLTLGSY